MVSSCYEENKKWRRIEEQERRENVEQKIRKNAEEKNKRIRERRRTWEEWRLNFYFSMNDYVQSKSFYRYLQLHPIDNN